MKWPWRYGIRGLEHENGHEWAVIVSIRGTFGNWPTGSYWPEREDFFFDIFPMGMTIYSRHMVLIFTQ